MDPLVRMGWTPYFARLAHDLPPARLARVLAVHRTVCTLGTGTGEACQGVPAGRLRDAARSDADLPTVGDWVVLARPPEQGLAAISAVLPRASRLSRHAAATPGVEQVLAANVDTVFVVTSLNQELNPRRLERYLAAAAAGGVPPVVLLSKADLVADAAAAADAVRAVAPGVPVHPVSVLAERGLDALAPYLAAGRTVALLGSSGVGKSTLLNRLLGGTPQAVQAISDWKDRGTHTTTARQLFPLPGGALMIDTPGLRALQPWLGGEDGALNAAFADVAAFAGGCRFRDCRHEDEPGCAVRDALERGDLPPGRFESYRKLERERIHAEREADPRTAKAHARRTGRLYREGKRLRHRRDDGEA